LLLFGFGKKDQSFYDLLELQADAAHRAALEFHALCRDFGNRDAHTHRIEEIEHEADRLTHQLANKVDATFVTPLDKEDLNSLSATLDDVTDLIESTTGLMALYQLSELRPDVESLIALLVRITEATQKAVAALRSLRGGREAFQPLLIRIHDIEDEHDQAYREAVATLFNTPDPDPLQVIKWKEIYDSIEAAVDKCEDVAKSIESVAVKYA
jgi:predicted phosphate transport protein (TIGR00153 family)